MSTKLINEVKSSFKSTFKKDPLLIFSPGRINIIGEHTDYNGGFVFPAAVDKGIAAAIQKSDAGHSTAIALDLDSAIEFELDKLKPSKEGSWENYVFGVVAEIQNRNKVIGDFNIVLKGDIPAGSGMSSSAALENSVVFGLNELFDLSLTKTEMILISQKAEHNYVGVNCGIMDQYASMFGIKNNALLLDCRTIESKPYEIDFKDHQLMLINTNVKHSLSDSAYNDRRSACESVAALLKVATLRDASEEDLEKVMDKITPENYQKALYVIQEIDRTQKAAKAIENNDLETLGALIYASHNGLQHQYKVSCEELDFLVAQAKKNKKVLGARMMGGGFGGCTINLIAKSEAKAFADSVAISYKNKFNKECSVYFVELSDGTHIVQ
ncbi:MAG: galactokinase [Flavobacteriia bacterium]|nr:galactokinase [Flavobacteriia bacterium]OIP47153.1 MAG: galactokinase [Flavobacteriaceae bacterium CG2_30_31_66]PIV97693.1 MAG: galactokinase [Flavobacteriaceae bacterium CG17_big_fil_post_rev_8_21_14_2_50_31_13]PIX13347.1 MAG: galactokinase [Flavobacteriaceae bacterium CG_4_8_14_3_um_filter_31_8]PIY13800.1 MAG: galactokinase [Flavobacteriaceae bacterium CG_4_10_14_3_um_filter_31_253]PIZ10724.1 MAG: galactokinase [Flavobacteriaceae bacterium CG_4_10_14_0_8_um_filter_31_99]PJC09914.1 MAG: g